MGKHRVYEIAKELGKTNQEVIDVLAKNNIQVKSLSTVDDSAKDLVVRAFTKKPVQPEKRFCQRFGSARIHQKAGSAGEETCAAAQAAEQCAESCTG